MAVETGWRPERVWCVTSESGNIITRRNGKVIVTGNCEGFDAPRATVCLWARPTKSGLLYTQGTGRVLRPYPAPEQSEAWAGWRKRYAIIVDFVDNTSAVGASLVTAPTLFGLRPDFNMKGKGALETVDEIEKIKAAKPSINLELYTDLARLKAIAEKIDLFAVPVMPMELRGLSMYTWMTGASTGSYQLSLPDKGMLVVKQNALGEFEVSKHMTGIKTPLGTTADLREALKLADNSVPLGADILLKSDANWRRLPVSPAQLGKLRYLYPELRRPFASNAEFESMIMATYDRGAVSQMLDARNTRN